MTKSCTEDVTKSSDRRPRSGSEISPRVPLHFTVHKPGCHFESCCGVCNLFPGVLLIAFCQVLVGSVLLTLILTHGKQYDKIHNTPDSQIMSLGTGAMLSGVTGASVSKYRRGQTIPLCVDCQPSKWCGWNLAVCRVFL
ncbi:hypothetical protein RR48_00140 [Papilio machaon]|uniref:Uncharacterized protein n=1 Tax=Papilio machaon TaxID=76193 RepID=A0A0N1ID36_PAPMA|nr:hypothetical protein RR48_00140 [Papilio machaon]